MKKILILALIALFSCGCAERTHIMTASKSSKQEKRSFDSTGIQTSRLIDKTVTTTERSVDTTATITGKAIAGEIDTRFTGDDGTVSQRFENDDIDLLLSFNKNTGKASAKATPKPKQVNLKFKEKTTISNDISKTDNSQSKVKSNFEIKTDTASKFVNKHTDPATAVSSLRKVVIWFAILLVCAAGFIIFFKKKFQS